MTNFGLSYGTFGKAKKVFDKVENGIYVIMMTRLGRYHVVEIKYVEELKKLGAQVVL